MNSLNKHLLKRYPGIKGYRSLIGKLYAEYGMSGRCLGNYIILDVTYDNTDEFLITLYHLEDNKIFSPLNRRPRFIEELIINKITHVSGWKAEILE